jgi:signal transduction histidine kinase
MLEIRLNNELDVLAARQRTRQLAVLFGFTPHEQTRLSAVVSELARKATNDNHPGLVTLSLSDDHKRQAFVIAIHDRVSFTTLDKVGEPDEVHELIGMAANQPSLRYFVDSIDMNVSPDGATVVLSKTRPESAPYLDHVAIEDAVTQLEPLSSTIALSEASRHVREFKIKTDSISNENLQLHEQAHVLSSADQRKDEFLAVLAHELRGPLSAVVMAAEMLAKGTSNPEQAANSGQLIRRQAGYMNRIVEDLLDVSRIVRNEVSIEKEPVDIRDVLASTVEQLASAVQRRNHRVTLHQCDEGVLVLGDRNRLIQVVGNLMGNAVRYTPEGGYIAVTVTVQLSWVCIAVSDDGIGMSADLIPDLFDMFKQGQRSADGRNSGLGLGLALVKTFVEAHGGKVNASSDGLGRGSTFKVYLPRIDASAIH